MTKNNLLEIAKVVRYWSVKLPTVAGSGHPTSSASAVELMSALLFGGYFNYDLKKIDNVNNDHLFFSKGHASSLFYALWHVAGVINEKELLTYRQFNSLLEGHPTRRFKMTEAATGSLGQGLALAMGKAMASLFDNIHNKVYVLLGDSELAEGSVWEAAQLAGYYRLPNLVAIVDVNRLGQRGETMYGHDVKKLGQRWQAFGWQVVYIKNGNDINEVDKIYQTVLTARQEKPLVIIAKTEKGAGIPEVVGKEGWHGKPLSLEQWQNVEQILMPKNINLVAAINLPASSIKNKVESLKFKLNKKIGAEITATRFAVTEVLANVAKNKQTVFIDAEVGNSTGLDKAKISAGNRYLQAFIAEQTMVGVATGMALSGKKPIIATFGAFLTRAYDQLRMAAYNQANITCVGTHAGVAIGEDGASQMALEDVSMFRSLFASIVLQPADDVSAMALTEIALNYPGISYLRTLRQVTPRIYSVKDKFTLGGCGVINNFASGEVVILASGTTVHEAIKAQQLLQQKNINVGVVDVYSIKPLAEKKIIAMAQKASAVITVEDHYLAGGLGEAVNSVIAGQAKKVINLAVKVMPRSGKSGELLKFAGIDSAAIVKAVEKIK